MIPETGEHAGQTTDRNGPAWPINLRESMDTVARVLKLDKNGNVRGHPPGSLRAETTERTLENLLLAHIEEECPDLGAGKLLLSRTRGSGPATTTWTWKSLCEFSGKQRRERKVSLDILSAVLLEAVAGVRDMGSKAGKKRFSDEAWARVDPGQDVRECEKDFRRWLKSPTTPEEARRYFVPFGARRKLSTLVLSQWSAVAIPGTATSFIKILEDDTAWALFENPGFDEKRYREYADEILNRALVAGTASLASITWAQDMTARAWAKGWRLDKEVVDAMAGIALGKDEGNIRIFLEYLAFFGDAGQDPRIREALLKRAGDKRFAAMLAVARGDTWVNLIQSLVDNPAVKAGFGFEGKLILEALENTRPEQLAGLDRASLLPLISCDDSRIRDCGRRMVAKKVEWERASLLPGTETVKKGGRAS